MKEEKTILFQDNFIHNSIKDAFLQLLMKKDYMQITIPILQYAGVSRGTFYAHFGNIGQVVDELFSDALCDIKNMALLSENASNSNSKKGLCWVLRKIQNISRFFLRSVVSSSCKAYCCGTKARFS